MYSKKNSFKIGVTLFFILSIISINGCDDTDNLNRITSSILSLSINDNTLNDGDVDIPLNSTIEIVFSSAIVPAKFENAFTISTSSQDAPYSISYINQSSKVVVVIENMAPNTIYSIAMAPSVIFENGQSLPNTVTYEFTTTNELVSKIPCSSASNDCIEKLEISLSGSTLAFDFYSNYDFISDTDFVWEDITNVIFSVHGLQRNADEYFTYMSKSIKSIGTEKNTVIIAPFFKDEQSAENTDLFWNNSNWREGDNSSNTNASVSSFSVIDAIIDILSKTDKFPNLKTVFVAGHSSGAAFVQHYALANKAETSYSNLDFKYLVANNQYFYYPDGMRFNESTNEFYIPTDCSGYTNWPYGYDNAISYINGVDASTLTDQQVLRNTTYFLGSNDTFTEGSLNTTDCQATLLGSNRVTRGENMFLYMQTFYESTNQHQKITVDNVGHNAEEMFNSPEFKEYLATNSQ